MLDSCHSRVLSEDVTGNQLSSMQEAVDGGIHATIHDIELSTHKVQSVLLIGCLERAQRFTAFFILFWAFTGRLRRLLRVPAGLTAFGFMGNSHSI